MPPARGWPRGWSGGIEAYADRRDRMDLDGTSRLSQDLRWGLLSPLEVVERAGGPGDGRRVFASEVAWREFYAHVLWHHPRVLREPFQPAFAALPWRDDPDAVDAWREGRTGYPVVDAAMRQLRASGFVHNRARMIAASFLAKHLLADWRTGRGGVHAPPHRRRRREQQRRLAVDREHRHGPAAVLPRLQPDPPGSPLRSRRRLRPALGPGAAGHRGGGGPRAVAARCGGPAAAGVRIGTDYPAPIVDHAAARARALAVYGATKAAAKDA